MVEIRYEASGFSGFFDENAWEDYTTDDAEEVMQDICNSLQNDIEEDDEIEVRFFDGESGDELGSAWIDASGWQLDPAQ